MSVFMGLGSHIAETKYCLCHVNISILTYRSLGSVTAIGSFSDPILAVPQG